MITQQNIEQCPWKYKCKIPLKIQINFSYLDSRCISENFPCMYKNLGSNFIMGTKSCQINATLSLKMSFIIIRIQPRDESLTQHRKPNK